MFKVQVQAAKHQEGWGWWWGRAKEEGAKAKAAKCWDEQVVYSSDKVPAPYFNKIFFSLFH